MSVELKQYPELEEAEEARAGEGLIIWQDDKLKKILLEKVSRQVDIAQMEVGDGLEMDLEADEFLVVYQDGKPFKYSALSLSMELGVIPHWELRYDEDSGDWEDAGFDVGDFVFYENRLWRKAQSGGDNLPPSEPRWLKAYDTSDFKLTGSLGYSDTLVLTQKAVTEAIEIPTKAEAENGGSTKPRRWTSQRVWQAIAKWWSGVTVPISQGGTGKTSAAEAIVALGAAAASHTHTAANITSGTLAAALLPTATASAKGAVKLATNTVQTTAASSPSSVAGKTYPVQLNGSGGMVVNVPWEEGSLTGASHDELDNRDLPNQHPISAITDLASELDSKVLKHDKDSFDSLTPYAVGIAIITSSSSSHSINLTGLVTELGLEVGDIIQIFGSSYAANNRIRRVESIVNDSEVVLSRRFQFINAIQAGNAALVNEAGVLLSIKRVTKWYTTSSLNLGAIATQEAMESTKSLNGYLKANGVIIQWGRADNILTGTSDNSTNVMFPIAFPVQCCSVQVSPYLALKGNASATYGVGALTASSFNVKCRLNEDDYNNITYIAIGY